MTQKLSLGTALMLTVPPVLWAGNAVVGRLVSDLVPPITLNFLRWLIAFVILLPLAGKLLKPSSPLWPSWRRFAILSLLGVGCYNALQYLALQTSTPLNVTLVYRRGRDRMNASVFEQDLAASKGVRIVTNARPVRVNGVGLVREIEFEYTDTARAPTGETLRLVADQVFKAIGQSLVGTDLPRLDGRKIAVSGAGRTSVSGVWAGGDCSTGGDDLTVTAVAEGRDAAEDIHSTLMAEG